MEGEGTDDPCLGGDISNDRAMNFPDCDGPGMHLRPREKHFKMLLEPHYENPINIGEQYRVGLVVWQWVGLTLIWDVPPSCLGSR